MAKEFTLTFDSLFTSGLRQNERAPRNSQVFTTLTNVRVRPEGLTAYEPLIQPVSDSTLSANSVSYAFPFPQLFRGKYITLLVSATKLFVVNETTWTLTPVTTYDLYNTGLTKTITSGGSWHFTDFWNTFILYNGSCCIIKFGGDSKYYVQDTLTIQTGCAHRGRAIQAGFSTSNFWSSDWKSFWTSRITQYDPPYSNVIKTMADIGPNWIHWSSIGGGDLRFLHDLTWATTGPYAAGYTSDNPMVLDFALRNEWGWMPMSFQGSVLAVKSLGMNVFVGGEDGIEVLTQVSSPRPTFGSTLRLPFGLAGRSAVGGGEDAIIFLDESGCLWRLDANLKLDRLDYSEFLNPMLGTEIIITQDPHSRDFFIANTDDAYSLSRDGGLSKVPQKPTSISFVQGGSVGMFTSETDESFVAVSEWFDLGTPGLKQLYEVLVTGAPDELLEVAFDYRYDRDSSETRTPYVYTNSHGVAFNLISGNEFRLVLRRQSSYASVQIQKVEIKWKSIDARYRH